MVNRSQNHERVTGALICLHYLYVWAVNALANCADAKNSSNPSLGAYGMQSVPNFHKLAYSYQVYNTTALRMAFCVQ